MRIESSKFDWEALERTDWNLWLMAILLILVLAVSVLSFMFPIVFWMGNDLLLKAPERAFVGFCILLVLSLVYLLQKQANVRRLKRELIEAQAALSLAQSQAAIVESTDDAIIGKTLDGYILTWNQGAEDLYGYSADSMKGRHISVLIPSERLDMLRQNLEAFRQGKSIKRYQTVSIRKDGTKVPVILTISPVRNAHGDVVGSATIARDLSARLQIEHDLKQAQGQLQATLTELERRNEWLSQFSQLTQLLESTHSPEEAYTLVADFAKKVFPADSGALYLLSPSKKVVEAVAVWGESSDSQVVFSPDDCWGLRLGKAHLSENGSSSPGVCRHLTKSKLGSSLCAPLVAQGEVFALLFLHMVEPQRTKELDSLGRTLTTKQRLAMTFAERIGVSFANLKLREQLRLQSIRDPLTGLFNRRYLDETLEREVSRALRMHSTLGIVMLDLDHFKKFNDAYGHDAGDALLHEVGSFLNHQSRKQDIACRYGGEEFTLIFPDASVEATARRAENLRTQASGIHVMHKGQLLGPISFSLGVAALPKHGSTPEAILKEADNALYRAKAEGRDRVVVGS